jgi:hypothetical protein
VGGSGGPGADAHGFHDVGGEAVLLGDDVEVDAPGEDVQVWEVDGQELGQEAAAQKRWLTNVEVDEVSEKTMLLKG